MKIQDNISISYDVLESLLIEEIKKVPGIKEENIKKIKFSDKDGSINIYITPFNLLSNLTSIACEVQQAINFYLNKQFDIGEGKILINIFVDVDTKE